MALSSEQKNTIQQALESSGMLAEFTDVQNTFDSLFDLNDFSAILQYHNDATVLQQFQDVQVGQSAELFDVALEKIVANGANVVDVSIFLRQLYASPLPKLYNFFKAGCFIGIEEEVKETDHYPVSLPYEDATTTVTRFFYNPLEYYEYGLAECGKQFEPASSIDNQINQYILNTKSVISGLPYTLEEEVVREDL
jgi:hypothetical protein